MERQIKNQQKQLMTSDEVYIVLQKEKDSLSINFNLVD